jgi:hypothetical protein
MPEQWLFESSFWHDNIMHAKSQRPRGHRWRNESLDGSATPGRSQLLLLFFFRGGPNKSKKR